MPSLIIGGARSGKSSLAERLAVESGREVVMIVTADARAHAGDQEMQARIAAHRRCRPQHWRTVEAPLRLAAALREWAAPHRHVVVDCLTLWLCNLLLVDSPTDPAWSGPGPHFESERAALLHALPSLPGEVTLVGNEVGHGIVSVGALNRLFVDESGRLNQAVAQRCERVFLVVAGCLLTLKEVAR
jgi:adenosylcobinamide kinase / adenosylcobinamide-phosphate guanylyltransferase